MEAWIRTFESLTRRTNPVAFSMGIRSRSAILYGVGLGLEAEHASRLVEQLRGKIQRGPHTSKAGFRAHRCQRTRSP